MKLTINGENREVPVAGNLTELLRHLEIEPDGIAVARNDTVISRDRFEETPVEEGDRLEIIRAVAGG